MMIKYHSVCCVSICRNKITTPVDFCLVPVLTVGQKVKAGGRINQWRYQNERNFNETVT
ncbi:MAG: hypothetical protein PUA49_05095 [Butyrivibrio sp.]|nr:hypothetical protein [Butyrivibrio sp.]